MNERKKHYSQPDCDVDWCSRWQGGVVMLCDSCKAWNDCRYPQGWVGYPGDRCKHGTYVGGCGVDWICGQCEGGENDVNDDLTVVVNDVVDHVSQIVSGGYAAGLVYGRTEDDGYDIIASFYKKLIERLMQDKAEIDESYREDQADRIARAERAAGWDPTP